MSCGPATIIPPKKKRFMPALGIAKRQTSFHDIYVASLASVNDCGFTMSRRHIPTVTESANENPTNKPGYSLTASQTDSQLTQSPGEGKPSDDFGIPAPTSTPDIATTQPPEDPAFAEGASSTAENAVTLVLKSRRTFHLVVVLFNSTPHILNHRSAPPQIFPQ
jgi:hypothetical protein